MSASETDVLRMIEEGGKSQAIADITGLPRGYVVQVARKNGYGLNVSSDRFHQVAPKPAPPVGIVRASQASDEDTAEVDSPASPSVPLAVARASVRDLLEEAKASRLKNTRSMAARIERELRTLAERVDREKRTAEIDQAKAREQAAARAEVQRLEKQLRDAKARLKGAPPAKPATDPEAAPREPGKRAPIGVDFVALDAWCQETGREWRKFGKGRPTNALIEEFHAATGGGDAA